MRNAPLLLLFFMGSKAFTQSPAEQNVFSASEMSTINTMDLQAEDPGIKSDQAANVFEGEDPLPAPIDGFIPWLLTLAFGLIFYKKGLARS